MKQPPWVQRPDIDGNLGWEPEDVPEWQRWWAYWRFDELPRGDTLDKPSTAKPDSVPAEQEQDAPPVQRSRSKRAKPVPQRQLI